jgi:hypothetical protein
MAQSKADKVVPAPFDPTDLTEFVWDYFSWAEIPWEDIDWDDPDIGNYTNLCPDQNRSDFEYGAYLIAKSARQEVILNKARKAPSKVKRELDHLIEVMDKLSFEARAALDSASRFEKFRRHLVKLIQALDEVPDLFSPDPKIQAEATSRYSSPAVADKARLKQAEEAFGRLSKDAKTELDVVSDLWSEVFNGPVDRMRRLTSRAIDSIEDGERKPDLVRSRLGTDAWAIWAAHGGDVNAKDFVDFLDRLIDAARLNGDGGSNARANADTLVRDIRNRAKNSRPMRWQLWSD